MEEVKHLIYLIGEKTTRSAKNAIKAAAHILNQAQKSVISVNGNFAALCPKEIIQLAKITDSKIEVNLFYSSEKRKKAISKILRESGAKEILGMDKKTVYKTERNRQCKEEL